jgi:hypothetical protein
VRLKAQALDGLGRPEAADPWRTVSTALPTTLHHRHGAHRRHGRRRCRDRTPPRLPAQPTTTRGHAPGLTHATALVTRLASRPDPDDDHLQIARIELATIQLSTNAQREARGTAEAVRQHYDKRGLPDHAHALTAQSLLAQAWLTLPLFELNPNPDDWREATASLGRLREQLRRTHGPLNPWTLSVDVEYGHALLCLGRPRTALPHLTATLSRLEDRFTANHPLTLQARLLLARSYAQLRDYTRSRDLHDEAYTGLLTALGPHHPDTLHAQCGLGVTLVLTGDRRRGWQMLAAVRRTAPSSVGRNSDLYAVSVVATALFTLPGGIWRLVDRHTNGHPRPEDVP